MKYINTNKIEKLQINKENVYLVIDFDRTITKNTSDDSWKASGIMLGKDFASEMKSLYEKYRPIELNYQITTEKKEKAMEEWYGKCMNLYFKYNLTQEKIEESVKKSNLIYREGVQEFLKKASQINIPIIILSAGIGNIIEEFLKVTDCYYDNIYIISNFLDFDKNGNIKEFDNSKMIHTLNKTMKGKLEKELIEKIKKRKYKILIGDLKEDENMVEQKEWDTTLKIGILEENIKGRLNVYKETFDIVLTNNDATFKILDEIIF